MAAGQGDAREIIRTGEGASREQDRAVWLWSCTPPQGLTRQRARDLPAAGKGQGLWVGWPF